MCHSLGVFKMEICLLEEGTVENLQFAHLPIEKFFFQFT